MIKKFPKDIEDFANVFIDLQAKRHAADYDPSFTVYKSEVVQDIAEARTVIERFLSLPVKDRRAFVTYVLFKDRRETFRPAQR